MCFTAFGLWREVAVAEREGIEAVGEREREEIEQKGNYELWGKINWGIGSTVITAILANINYSIKLLKNVKLFS